MRPPAGERAVITRHFLDHKMKGKLMRVVTLIVVVYCMLVTFGFGALMFAFSSAGSMFGFGKVAPLAMLVSVVHGVAAYQIWIGGKRNATRPDSHSGLRKYVYRASFILATVSLLSVAFALITVDGLARFVFGLASILLDRSGA